MAGMTAIDLVIWLLVLFRGVSYWLLSALRNPGESLSVQALYRAGDMEYFPLIQALARGNWGEFALLEPVSRHLGSFPLASIALHSFFYKFFGVIGFPIADLIATMLYFWLLVQVLRLFQVSKLAAQAVALLVVSGALNQLVSMISDPIFGMLIMPTQSWLGGLLGVLVVMVGGLLGLGIIGRSLGRRTEFLATILLVILLPIVFSTLPLQVWGWRLPRPFVSEIFLLLVFLFSGRIFLDTSENKKNSNWLGLGFSIAALLQGDFHSTVIAAIALAGLLICQFVHPFWASDRFTLIKKIPLVFVSAGIGVIPFVLQQQNGNLQAPIRLGVFTVNRLSPLFLPSWMPYVMLLGVLVSGVALVQKQKPPQPIIFWCIWSIAACFALPISILILGKTVQPFQFLDRDGRVLLFTLIIFGSYAIQRLQPQLTGYAQRFTAQPARLILPIILAIALAFNLKEANALTQASSHMRADFEEWGKLKNYRSEFVALTQELQKPSYRDRPVMGTFDIQPYVWWVGFNQGRSFLPPAPLTTVDDAVIEQRLAQFCRLLGMAPEQYFNVINRRLTQIFWLGHNKYQASGAHTYAPINDYFPADQAAIANTGILNSQNVILPISEQRRLLQQYLRTEIKELPQLDIIVLDRDSLTLGLEIKDNRFIKTYENGIFQVWIAR